MNSREYWAKREEEQLKHYIRDEAEYDRRIRNIYATMLDNTQKEIDAFYAKYAEAEGITIATAKRRVARADIEAYERKAERYVRNRTFTKRANEEMRLYNAMMRINRLEMLKANIGMEMISGYDELEKFMGEILKGRTMEELERQAGILGKTIQHNATKANAIVNASFHNATFSDRVWQYHDLMREDLGRLLQTALIQGKNPRALAGELRKYWYGNNSKGGARYCMERLMRTELARVQTEAQRQSFERNGFAKYIFIVNAGCCPICEAIAKKKTDFAEDGVFLVEDMQPGENAPPMHPHCRCSTAAWEDDNEYEAWLNHLSNGGTTDNWTQHQASQAKVQDAIQSKYGFNRIKGKHGADEDLAACNPNYSKDRNYQINCQRCVPTYEMRRRGYNVEALPYNTNKDAAYVGWMNIFDGALWDSSVGRGRGRGRGVSTETVKQNVVNRMLSYGDGARAEIYVCWKGASSAHVFAAENVGGNVRFIDPQTGDTNCERYFARIKPSETMICRIDNLEPSDLITGCCKNKE